jgi:hypothetical protein
MLCEKYGDLSETHILPQSAGNNKPFSGWSLGVSLSEQRDRTLRRRFPHGVQFRTLCRDCNNALGGSEDKELARLFALVRAFAGTSIKLLPELTSLEVRVNLIIRGVLAHLLSANDRGYPGRFEQEVRSLFRGEKTIRECPLRVFYWRYTGQWLTIVRDISVMEVVGRRSEPDWLQVLKLNPIGFAVTDQQSFRGLPCLNNYATAHDSAFAEIPFRLFPSDSNAQWPANTGERGIMLTGAGTSLVVEPMWRHR